MKDVNAKPKLITQSNDATVIFNGIPDWLYEEEILGQNNAIWWSPNGTRLAFASFNDSMVDIMTFSRYGSYHDFNNLYPFVESIRYPKVSKMNDPLFNNQAKR